MCWRDDIVTHRRCIMCRQPYYGDLGHRNCPARIKPAQPKPDTNELHRWADDGGAYGVPGTDGGQKG